MIGSFLLLCIFGFVSWLALNAGTAFAATKLDILEPDAPDRTEVQRGRRRKGRQRRRRSKLKVRYGPLSLCAKNVLVSEKTLEMVSGFLVGLYPVDVTRVQVDEYKVQFGWGLINFIKAWWKREGREKIAPKLVIRLVGVRIAIKENRIEDWKKQTEAISAAIAGANHNQANLLTALMDKTSPQEDVPPSRINRLVDGIVNAVDVQVEGLHFSLASADHEDADQGSTRQQQQEQRQQQLQRRRLHSSETGGGGSGSKLVPSESKPSPGPGWVLGVKFDLFRLCRKADPSEKTLGVTPRTLKLKSFNLYYDMDEMPVRRSDNVGRKALQDQNESGSSDGGQDLHPPPGATAVVRGEGEASLEGGTLEPSPLAPVMQSSTSDYDDISSSLRQPDDHNNLLMIESMGGTLLFPDLMCVLLGVGRQPGGNGKLMGIDFEEMNGVVLELEPFQVFGLLNDALPLLALTGPYTAWYSNVQTEWHKEAFARRGIVPSTAEELDKYAEALGSPPAGSDGAGDGEGKKYKGNATELKKLDKDMSLTQIMLARMRVRKWDVARPERLMNGANLLLNSMDPFQGLAADDLEVDVVPPMPDAKEGSGSGGGGEGDGDESDEESPSISSGQSETVLPSLQTDGPEEDARLQSLLYYVAQQSAHAGLESPVLMEIDIRMSAQNATVLVYQPPLDDSRPEKTEAADGSSSRELSLANGNNEAGADDNGSVDAAGGEDELPTMEGLSRQNSGGSVALGEGKGELATGEAMRLRDRLQLPALAASVVVDDFKFGFNFMMGSVASASGDDHDGVSEDPATPAGANDPEEQGVPVELHTFSGVLFPNPLPIRLYKPARLGQGADLRVESFGEPGKVGDGIAGMELLLFLGGTRVADFGALEQGGVLPTLIGGPAAAMADAANDNGGGGGGVAQAAGGTSKVTLALFSGGRLEAGVDFQGFSIVALPDRIMAIIDVVLACLMGPPAAQKAQELDALEDEVEMEEAEEATGAGGTTEIIDSRWKAIDKVRAAYLFLGRMDARFSVRVSAFSLLLPQDSRDIHTNVVMAQCSGLALDMKSGSAFEALALDVSGFSISPCVQHREVSSAAIGACARLHEAGVAIALRGPLPELLGLVHRGFPLKDLDLFPIPERRILLPVNMKMTYSTDVTLRVEDTLEASTENLIMDMVKANRSTNLAAEYAAAQQHPPAVIAGAALPVEEADKIDGTSGGGDISGDQKRTELATSETAMGLFVLMQVKLHVSSGLRLKVTDLDIAVLQGIAASLMASLGMGQAAAEGSSDPVGGAGVSTSQQSSAGKSLTYALDKAQRRMVASLRQAFRLADIDGDGKLDRAEVEALLRHNLQGHSLDPAQTEAEVLQFIALLDADGTQSLDIDEFTSTMMRLMTDGPDEVTLERARRQALTKAFHEADADGSGSLDSVEIMQLLKSSDPLRTQSELKRQVSRYIEQVDADGDGQLDLEEFMELVHSMRTGDVHEGPLEPTAEEFRTWEVIKPMLEGFKTLPELLAARAADYSPPGFWELFERETHATRTGSGGQLNEAVQAKMVKAFDNYSFARDAWSLLVAPAWYPGVVRVGSLKSAGAGVGPATRSVGPQHMLVPIRPGAPVYAQEKSSAAYRGSRSGSPLSGMRIQRLPEELAAPSNIPPVVDPSLGSTPTAEKKLVTGVRLPTPSGRLSSRGSASHPGVKMEIDRPCTLMVCFHDEAASTGANSGSGGGGGGGGGGGDSVAQAPSGVTRQTTSSSAGSHLEIPEWATRMGLSRTSMHIEAVLPADDDGARGSHHVYRVFSTLVDRGSVTLGSGLPGSLPYFVLLYGGNNVGRQSRRPSGVQRPRRSITDGGNSRRRRRLLHSVFKKKSGVRGTRSLGGGGGNRLGGSSSGSSTEPGFAASAVQRGGSGESIEMTRTTSVPIPERSSSVISASSSIAAVAAAVNANPSWQLTSRFSLGGATRGVTSIAAKADKNARKAASTAMKVAAISSAGTAAASAASSGAGGGVEVGKQPRVRLKVALLCEHGIFLQVDDLHRLKNTPVDAQVDPTFELALKVPSQSYAVPRSSGSSPPSIDEALSATLDFEHVASTEILGEQDSMAMNAAFGMEGKYFNPRVQQSEHFIEPWRMNINMGDPRGQRTPRGQMIADRHFVLNASTGLISLACSIMESQDYTRTRYSTTSVYTELRDGTRADDDGSRLLTIENHLGVPVAITLEDDGAEGSEESSARSFDSKKSGSSRPSHERRRSTGRTSHQARIAASSYVHPRATSLDSAGAVTMVGLPGEGTRSDGPPSDRISVGELVVPDAKRSLLTATVTIAAKGFVPVTGVPLDLLGRGTHAYRMTRKDRQNKEKGTKKWQFEGMVVKFVPRPARNPSVLDLAMQLQTNVTLKNDLPRPLRVALSPESANEPNTVIPVDNEVSVPFPILEEKVLRLWKSPRKLVGGDALKKVLQAEAEKKARATRGSRGGGGAGAGASSKGDDLVVPGNSEGAAGGSDVMDLGEEVSVEISSTAFDRNKRVVERHSQNMLMNGVSVERADLGPTPGLVMHGSGDEAPALWRLYMRAPYVVQNGLACDIVVWASQRPPEKDVPSGDGAPAPAESADRGIVSHATSSKRGLKLKSLGKKGSERVAKLASSVSSSGSKFKFSPKTWKKSSKTPTGAGVSPAEASGGVRGGDFESINDEPASKINEDDDDVDDDDSEGTEVVADDDDSDSDSDQNDDDEAEQEDDDVLDQSIAVDDSGADTGALAVAAGTDGADCAVDVSGAADDDRVMWVLKSGEDAKLEGMDMTRNLRIRIGFAPVDGVSSISDFSRPFIIEAKCHTNRTLLNKMESKEAEYRRGARGPSGARRPEFKLGAVWEHTPGNKYIHVYAKVWVVNKTGVSLAYRASMASKGDESKEKVFVRRPHNASYRTDSDIMLFSRFMTRGDKRIGGSAAAAGTGDRKAGGKTGLPLMLTCHANTLQTMPYAMADSAVGSPLLLSETRSSKSDQLLPCLTVPEGETAAAAAEAAGGGDVSAASWPLYCDYPPARVRLAKEVVPEGRRRVHLLTIRSDTGSVSFSPTRDCMVFVGLDKRVLEVGAPKWLGLRGFERNDAVDVAAPDVTPADLAPQGFGLYSRFCRGLSVVSLGENVDESGDTVENKRSGSAAMYFVVVVSVPEQEAVVEVDVGPVVMHRSVAKLFEFREHHRWRVKPNFKPGDPCYNDRSSSENTVTGLPERLIGKKLMQIVTAQGDKRVKATTMASFQTLQRSRVLVCFDSRASEHPKWLASRGFRFQADMHLPTNSAATGTDGYTVFAKDFPEGAEVKLGGNKASGAKRMYFVLVHAIGRQIGRMSAPPMLASPFLVPPSPPGILSDGGIDANSSGESGAVEAVTSVTAETGVGASDGTTGVDELTRVSKRKGGVAVESKDDQMFRFWDKEANGTLVQAPLDLDRQGRGWCEPFATDAVKTAGQAKSPAGVFGVTIDALSGAFLKTRVVTVWPRFVVRNNLGRKVGILPTLELPTKTGKDHGQSIATATKEEKEGLENVQRASRHTTQPVPDGASVVLYDFVDPDDYDYDEEEDTLDAITGFGGSPSVSKPSRKQLQLWKREKKGSREDKLPCVRLMSSMHKDDAKTKSGSGGDVEAGTTTDEQWVELPTVPVLLENMGKDTYVWMEGGYSQEDVLVRVSCRMLPNGATIHMVLSDETPSPPLRIENRSSTQKLCYRLGGDSDENVRLLEPMRWNSLHWVNDDKRYIEAAVYMDEDTGEDTISKFKRRAKSTRRKMSSKSSLEKSKLMFSSFRWGAQGKFGDSPRREYKTDDVGRLRDLVGGRRKVGGEVRLKVECLRPPDSVVTTVLAFSDTPDGVYGKGSAETTALSTRNGDAEAVGDSDDDKDPDGGEVEVGNKFARIWTGLHFEASFAGLVFNIIDSTPSGPSEMAAFTVDSFELGKPSGTPAVTLSVWHFQLDDMRADSPHPIILAPQSNGFNSHLTKVHKNGLPGSPALKIDLERDVQTSLTHHMTVIRAMEVSLGKVHCSVHVDFWIDVQDVVFASLNWVNTSPEQARAMAIAGTQGVVGKLLEAPPVNATVDRIYIGEYLQEEIEVAVDFHLGKKVADLLSSKPPADGDEEKDEGGFGASIAMMPLGAVGGVIWGLLSSFGAGIANASPTFNFDTYLLEHFYGSSTQAVRLVVMSFVKQGVVQAYKVLGHIDILGDPLSLGKSISSGVIGFVTKTGSGHIGEGSKDLVKGVVGGAASSASKMTDALDNFVRGAGGMDAEAPSGMESVKAPEHLGQGLTQGMMYFGHTVKDGITGVVMKPIRGAKKDGALGFVQGVGQGVVGLVAAPVSATLGATSKITASIDATTRLLDDDPMGRRREPRHPLGLGERDDRDRIKKQLKKMAQEKRLRHSRSRSRSHSRSGSTKVEELNNVDELEESFGGDGDPPSDEQATPLDVEAEAGGMGLLLLPLTPADMRANYPDEYIERCQADMASKAGAVAIANAIEFELAAFTKIALQEQMEGVPEEEDEGTAGEEKADVAVADGSGEDAKSGTEESKGQEGASATNQ